jgi:hypothetical protein
MARTHQPAAALLAGDEIYNHENLDQRRPTGVSVNTSRSAAVLEYIRSAEAEGTMIFTYHDPTLMADAEATTHSLARTGTRRVL